MNTAWISTATNRPAALPPDGGWLEVGEVEFRDNTDLKQHVDAAFGRRQSTSSSSPGFYLSGDPSVPWVAELIETGVAGRRGVDVPAGAKAAPVWLAIDTYARLPVAGDEGAGFVLSIRQVEVGVTLARRPPEAHPGSLVRWAMIPMRAKAPAGRRITLVRPSRSK